MHNDKSELILKKYYLKQFDSISLREKSGADYIKNNFNIDADNILDPVFLLDINEYENLINKTTLNENDYKNGGYIFCYFYNIEFFIDKVKIIADKLNKKNNSFNFERTSGRLVIICKKCRFRYN